MFEDFDRDQVERTAPNYRRSRSGPIITTERWSVDDNEFDKWLPREHTVEEGWPYGVTTDGVDVLSLCGAIGFIVLIVEAGFKMAAIMAVIIPAILGLVFGFLAKALSEDDNEMAAFLAIIASGLVWFFATIHYIST